MTQVALRADDALEFRSTIWNMPVSTYDSRGGILIWLLSQWMEGYRGGVDDKFRFLEIGVWRAGTIQDVSGVADFEYVGVDPYGIQVDDPYGGLFWDTSEEMNSAFEDASAVF